jgi:hypothetical protein
VHKALQAVRAARSVRISAHESVSGTAYLFDLVVFSNGDLDGSITANGFVNDFLIVKSVAYEKSSAAYYVAVGHTQAFAHAYGGAWLVIPPKSASRFVSAFGSSISFSNIEASLLSAETKDQQPIRTTLEGRPVISVLSGPQETLYLDAVPPYYPVEDNQGGTLTTFSNWNKLPVPAAPKGALTPHGT